MAPMEAKQLTEIGKQIAKASESGDSASSILNILAPLENFKATEELLRQSRIGVAVTKLRQNKDPQVSDLASRLVNRWKSEVHVGKKKRPEGSPAPANKAVNGAQANSRSSATASPAPQQPKMDIKKEPRKSTVDPEKRNTNTDGINNKVTGNPQRDGCLKLMYDGIAFMSEESPDSIFEVAQKVEAAAFSHFKNETNAEYKAKMRSLFQNLKMKGNSALRKNVFIGKTTPKQFVAMTSEELKSADQRRQDELIEKENMNKAMTAQPTKAISETMQCGKCKQFKVSYTQAQTRSADEPLTTFCECVNCGNKWKFS